MLTRDELEEIEQELRHYERKSAVCIEAMKIVQRHRGWVSDENLADLAQLLEMSVADLDGVATFYNVIFRKPVGRHVIKVCNSISCWMLGYDGLLERMETRLGITLGQTTRDDRFTLVPIQCLGDCDHAPALMIDDDLHHDVTAEGLDAILDSYR